MTYNSSWEIRNKGVFKIGRNFKSASILYNPSNIRIFSGSRESSLELNSNNLAKLNNNSEYSKYTLDDAIIGASTLRHRKLTKIFSKEELISPNSGSTNTSLSFTIGIKGRSDRYYMEDCRTVSTTCLSNQGTDSKCLPSKCFGGTFTFSKIENNKSVIKLDILRGSIQKTLYIKNIFFNKPTSSIYDYQINLISDPDSLIYYNESTIDKSFFKTIPGKIRIPLQLLYEINEDRYYLKNIFDFLLLSLFSNSCRFSNTTLEECIKNNLQNEDISGFKRELLNFIEITSYSSYIKEKIKSSIDNIDTYDNLDDYVTQSYDAIEAIFKSISYITDSGFLNSKKEKFRGELKGRPIYDRLPSSNFGYNLSGLEEDIIFTDDLNSRFELQNIESGQLVVLNDRSDGYKYIPRVIYSELERISFGLPRTISDYYDKNQIYSPKDPESWRKLDSSELPPIPVTKWLLEGADELLIESKERIERFYKDYLDPDLCLTDNLDWLAQHIGLNDSIYYSNTSEKIKRILIKNALGWESDLLSINIDFPDGTSRSYKTIKGEVLNSFPFNLPQWVETNPTKSQILKSKILGGQLSNNSFISNKNSSNKILFEKTISPETKKLISSTTSYLVLNGELSNEYKYILVRFYTENIENLPEFISENEKYYLEKISETSNNYKLYSLLGREIELSNFTTTTDIFVENQFKVEVQSIEKILYDKNLWQGIYQSKGSRLGIIFALSLPSTKSERFIHSHVLEELTVNSGTIIVSSGLREYESGNINNQPNNSSILRPWERSFLQVGDESLSFENQLIADISEVKDENESYDLIFRLPFYYNRNGRSWSYTQGVSEYWLPANVSSRVQYPYLASELWEVGDAFFELELNG